MKKLILLLLLAGTAPVYARITGVFKPPVMELIDALQEMLRQQQRMQNNLDSIQRSLTAYLNNVEQKNNLWDIVENENSTSQEVQRAGQILSSLKQKLYDYRRTTVPQHVQLLQRLRDQLQEHQQYIETLPEQELVLRPLRQLQDLVHHNSQQQLQTITQLETRLQQL